MGRREIPLEFDKRVIVGSLASSAIMGLAVYALAAQTGFAPILLPLYVIAGVCIFTATLSATKTLKMEDIQFLLKTIPKGQTIHQKLSITLNNSKLARTIKKLFS
jgi:hypothetical protein